MCPTGNSKKEDDNENVEQLEDENRVRSQESPPPTKKITAVLFVINERIY